MTLLDFKRFWSLHDLNRLSPPSIPMTIVAVLVLIMMSVAYAGSHLAVDHRTSLPQNVHAAEDDENAFATPKIAQETNFVWKNAELDLQSEEMLVFSGLDLRALPDPEQPVLNISNYTIWTAQDLICNDGMYSGNILESVHDPAQTAESADLASSSTIYPEVTIPSKTSPVAVDTNARSIKGSKYWSDEMNQFVATFGRKDHHRIEEIREFYKDQEAKEDPKWLRSTLRRSFRAMIGCYDVHCRKNHSVFKDRFDTLPVKSFYTVCCTGRGTECEYLKLPEMSKSRIKRHRAKLKEQRKQLSQLSDDIDVCTQLYLPGISQDEQEPIQGEISDHAALTTRDKITNQEVDPETDFESVHDTPLAALPSCSVSTSTRSTILTTSSTKPGFSSTKLTARTACNREITIPDWWNHEMKNFVTSLGNPRCHDRIEDIRKFYSIQEEKQEPRWLQSCLRKSFRAMLACYDNEGHCGGDMNMFKEKFPTLPLLSFHYNGCNGACSECQFLLRLEMKNQSKAISRLKVKQDPERYRLHLQQKSIANKKYHIKRKQSQKLIRASLTATNQQA